MPSVIYFPVICITCLCCLYLLFASAPEIDEATRQKIKFPKSVEDLKVLSNALQDYKHQHYIYVLTLFSFAYLFKQSFAVPGSVFLNILSGALFGYYGFILSCVLTATGAFCCYNLSKYFGTSYIQTKFASRIEYLRKLINENRQNLFWFLLFVRIVPFTPNWFLNIASPVVGISPLYFISSVFLGLMPYNFICVQAGQILDSISSLDDVFSRKVFLQMFGLAVVTLIPVAISRFFASKSSNIKNDDARNALEAGPTRLKLKNYAEKENAHARVETVN